MAHANELMNRLFTNLSTVNERLEQQQMLPNFQGGLDLRSRDGELIASYQPGVGAADGTIISGGDVVAKVRENVQGGTTMDMGLGHTVSSIPTVHGGETFYDSVEGVAGFTKPAFSGGLEFHAVSGETILAKGDPITGGFSISTTPAPLLPELDAGSMVASPLDSLDAAVGILEASHTFSILEGEDGLEILSLLGDFL